MAKFCPECGSVTERRIVAGQERDACCQCGFAQFARAKVGVGALVFRGQHVLLVERIMSPAGIWTIPSGYQEENENLEMAVKREVLEETGMNIRPRGIIFLRNMMEYGMIDMYAVFLCESNANEGPFVNDTESSAARFIPLGEFDELNVEPDSRWFIESYLNLRLNLMVPMANFFTHPHLQIFSAPA